MARHCDISPDPHRPVFVCRGVDCRKKEKQIQQVEALLAPHGEVCEVECQKICEGPVVGLEVNGRLEWFSRLASKSSRKHLALLLTEGRMKNHLRDRIARKRRGKLRGELALAAK